MVIDQVGLDFGLADVAAHAGVGLSTVYRRFAGRQELISAVFDRFIAEEIEPLVAVSTQHPDPWQGLVGGLESVIITAAANATLLQVVRDTELVTKAVTESFLQPLGRALQRAQAAGVARSDLDSADLPSLIAMVVATMVAVPTPQGEQPMSWRRYLALLLDGCRVESSSRPLPPA